MCRWRVGHKQASMSQPSHPDTFFQWVPGAHSQPPWPAGQQPAKSAPAKDQTLPGGILQAQGRQVASSKPGPRPPARELKTQSLLAFPDQHGLLHATHAASGTATAEVVSAFGLGRLVALQKLSGRVRGVVGGWSLGLWLSSTPPPPAFLEACRPHQFALSTRAGADSLVHAQASAAELGPEATVFCVDGVGAFDTVSRRAMHDALRSGANRCLPFVRLF